MILGSLGLVAGRVADNPYDGNYSPVVVNPRRTCAGGLRYLSCVSVCLSVSALVSTSFLSTIQVRYICTAYF